MPKKETLDPSFRKKLTKLQVIHDEAVAELNVSRSPLALERANGKLVTINKVLAIFTKEFRLLRVEGKRKKK